MLNRGIALGKIQTGQCSDIGSPCSIEKGNPGNSVPLRCGDVGGKATRERVAKALPRKKVAAGATFN
jgi:hypothetical protein